MYERSGLRLLRGGLDRELPVADVAPSGPAHTSGGRPRPRRRRRQPGRPGASRRGLPRTRRAAGFRRRDVRRLRTYARAVPLRGLRIADSQLSKGQMKISIESENRDQTAPGENQSAIRNPQSAIQVVREALEREPRVRFDRHPIQIAFNEVDDTVTLQGEAGEKDMAEFDAWFVFGVDKVINNLQVM